MSFFKDEERKLIKEDLLKIRYYYSYRKTLQEASEICSDNYILEKIKLYNSLIVKAHIRLYHIYYELYICGHSVESLANKLCFSSDYVAKLNLKLVNFFKEQIYTNS